MTEERSWRITSTVNAVACDTEFWVTDAFHTEVGWLVPDGRLQAIADAWNSPFADGSVTVGDAAKGVFPELAQAIEDALAEE